MTSQDDVKAEIELIGEIIDAGREDQLDKLEELRQEADEEGFLHAAIYARALLAASAGLRTGASAVDTVVGMLAESRRFYQEHRDRLLPEIVQPLLLQMLTAQYIAFVNPAIPLRNVDAVRLSFEEMLREHGSSLWASHAMALRIAIALEQDAEVDRLFALARSEPRDETSIGATIDVYVEWLARRERYREALDVFERTSRDDEPRYYRYTQLAAALPAVHLGQTDLADWLFVQSIDEDDTDSSDSPRLTYLAVRGRYDEALDWLPRVRDDEELTGKDRTLVAEHVVVLMQHLVAAGRGDERVECLGGTVAEVLANERAIAEASARTFDQVNGIDVDLRRVHDFWARYAPGVPLDAGRP